MVTRMKDESGIALIQVMVMSLILVALAAGVLQLIFGTHVMVARTKKSDDARYWIEACQAQKQLVWSDPTTCAAPNTDSACCGAGSDTDCIFTVGAKVHTVTVGCSGNQAIFKYDW